MSEEEIQEWIINNVQPAKIGEQWVGVVTQDEVEKLILKLTGIDPRNY